MLPDATTTTGLHPADLESTEGDEVRDVRERLGSLLHSPGAGIDDRTREQFEELQRKLDAELRP